MVLSKEKVPAKDNRNMLMDESNQIFNGAGNMVGPVYLINGVNKLSASEVLTATVIVSGNVQHYRLDI